jgi:2-methylcitrate dehydratase PrpD
MPLAAKIADFVSGLTLDSLPSEVERKARTCLLNGYGIALGCHMTPYAPVARETALALFGKAVGGATLLGDGRRSQAPGAALANASLFHGRAQEDTCGAAHLGAILIPALTALFEVERYPLDRFLPALVAGYEAGGLFETAYAPATTPAGFRASPLYGTIAAAAAAARAMALSSERVAAALANAASFAGGILQSFDDGTDEWRYQVGVAGLNGLIAARLAADGSVSAPRAFEGRSGFVRAFARADCDVDALARRLGRDWSIHRVTFKPYPVCAFNQTPVTGALVLRERRAGQEIESVRVRMNPYETGYAGMDSKGPFGTVSGTLMSIPFCIALTLLRGTPTMASMTTYDDPEVNDLMARIELVPDEGVARLCCVIEAALSDGRSVRHEETKTTDDYNYGWDEVLDLVRRVGAESAVPEAAFERIASFAERVPDAPLDDVLEAFAMLPRARPDLSPRVRRA